MTMPRAVEPHPWLRDSPGAILGLFRSDAEPLTKADVVRLSGLSRTAVNARVNPLIEAGILRLSRSQSTTGGRPAERYELNRDWGVVLIADMGATAIRAAASDLRANILAERTERIDIGAGPEAVLARVDRLLEGLLAETGRDAGDVVGIGLDVPGPVDHERGRVIRPPIMTGWHDFDVPGHFAATYSGPVLVEKDTNAMAFGEQRIIHHDTDDVVFVKLGTGVGTGMVIRGEIYRGADGAAGDIGHIPLVGTAELEAAPLCRCGNRGCIEAYASGWAMVRDLDRPSRPVRTVDDVIRLAETRDHDALRAVRRAAEIVGTAVSDLVNIINPRTIVVGGQLAAIEDGLIAGIREVVYRRSLPLATRDLEIVSSELGSRAGVYGLARLVIDEVLSASRIDHLLANPPATAD